MDDQEMYEKVCGPKMSELSTRTGETNVKIDKLTKIITEDNGRPSMLSRLRTVEDKVAAKADDKGMSFSIPGGGRIDGIRDPIRLSAAVGIIFLVVEKLGILGAIQTVLTVQP